MRLFLLVRFRLVLFCFVFVLGSILQQGCDGCLAHGRGKLQIILELYTGALVGMGRKRCPLKWAVMRQSA